MFLAGIHTACLLTAAGLLLLAGVVKLRTPEPTARALRGVGLPGPHAAVRALALLEILVGAAVLVNPALGAAPLAILYACFAAFLAYVLRKKLPLSSCGCLGETESRPSRVHLAVTLCATAAGTAAAFHPPPGLEAVAADGLLVIAPLAIALVTAVYLTYLVLALLPEALSAYRAEEG
jgi:methylamine utilization protein MauE